MTRPRIAILHQGFVPQYRVRFFELLAGSGAVEYVVFHGSPPPGTGHVAAEPPFAFPNVAVDNRWMSVLGRNIVYQPVVRQISGGAFAGAVLGAELKFLSSLTLFGALKARGRSVVLWGHGGDKREDTSAAMARVARMGGGVKRRWAAQADAYLVYTEGGAQRLRDAGLAAGRIHVVRNTLDIETQAQLHADARAVDPAVVRRELGLRPDSAVLGFLGRVYREKRVDELVRLVDALNERGLPRPVEALVIGDGPALAEARAAANGSVRFVGDVRDQARVARLLRVVEAVVIPGKVGLAVNHSFAHGLPLLTRAGDLHAPEVEYVEHGVNGLLIEGGFDAFVDAVAGIVTDEQRREAFAAGARATAERLSLATMAQAFDAGVQQALPS